MTANELADKLDEIYTGTDYVEIKQAATMLRQQAQEIEALKLRELTNDEIMEICDEVGRDITRWGYFQIEFARAILAKASKGI
jgi:hypothetical protein